MCVSIMTFLGAFLLGLHYELAMKIVCCPSGSVAKSLSQEADVNMKSGVGSKRDARSRRAEILHALGKSTTESDVTEGCDQFCILIYNYHCDLLSFHCLTVEQ